MQMHPARNPTVRVLAVALESLAALTVATGLVAGLQAVAPITALGAFYLLPVLFMSIRHGTGAGLATALVGVVTLNFLFIEPRYQLAVADSEDLVALVVFFTVALVVGRLAAMARRQAATAEVRASVATARGRDARTLAEAASSVLGAGDRETQLANIAASVAASTEGEVRLELSSAPTAQRNDLSVPLMLSSRKAWLHARKHAGWDERDLIQLAHGLSGLIDVALEQQRIKEHFAETEAARQADVAKTALLHAVSHDLRSPLTAIAAAAAALRTRGVSAQERADLIAAVEEEAGRLARLVDDLLDISRIQAGATNPRTDWCDLLDVVSRAAAQVQSARPHPIEIDLPSDLPLVKADPSQLERVFSNLIENAVKFSPPGVPVRVRGQAEGRVTVRVIDSGPGIPRSSRAHVFEPFFRDAQPGHGAGLGLAICRGLVEANGGSIKLQHGGSEGASFAVSFPLVAQPVPAG
jgi:two-component system, OmpR family, sensor histidine kinase KdpD